jgi:hypothetical protein
MYPVLLRVLRSLALFALFALFLACALPSCAQNDPTKRLVLKDGSYQSVVKWEVKGDRVRYLSAERFEWEEVPGSLVDWDATNKYADDLKKGVSHSAAEVDKEVEAERKEMDARSPEIAPGLRLPDTGGVFLFETFAQLPQLVELAQNGSDINRNTGTNILRATVNPLASAKQTIELPGLHAAVQAHGGRPAIYVSAADEAKTPSSTDKNAGSAPADKNDVDKKSDPAAQRFQIVRLQPKKSTRVVGNLKIAVYGKVSQDESFVPSSMESVSGSWFKLTPSQDLAPGEYAVVEMLNSKDMNLYIWDFGVNPAAPANQTAWKPIQTNVQTGGDEPPTLQKKPN